jgi:uncharacterized protein (TIGR00290 family)
VASAPVILSWSEGKDCTLAPAALRPDSRYEVVCLASGFCRETDRIEVHEVRRGLIRTQAACRELKLVEVDLPAGASNTEYESCWQSYFELKKAEGIRHVAYGDLFLEDIRAYRERFMEAVGMSSLFPLWGRPTRQLAFDACDHRLQAVVCSCDVLKLRARFVGRLYNREFLNELPDGIDPCGENGEFHTFAFDGPGFTRPVQWSRGDTGRLGSVSFCDLLSGHGD